MQRIRKVVDLSVPAVVVSASPSWVRALMGLAAVMAIMILNLSEGWCGGQTATESLTGGTWEWHQTVYNNDTTTTPPTPSHYTVAFGPDGMLNIRVDCNRAGGRYTAGDSAIHIEVTHGTRAMCPSDSLDSRFVRDLNAATLYFFRNGFLYLDLKYDTGTMRLGR